MGKMTKYEPGTFSWVDLATSDLDGAKDFYGKLFGWDFDDRSVGEDGGETYSMAAAEGSVVAGAWQADGPSRWNSYITVESASDAAEKAEQAGAKVQAPAFDVMEDGRMAVIQDPSGAVVSLWEPKGHAGAELVTAHGALTWNDLETHDVPKAIEFYCEVFGWEVAPVDEDAGNERVVIRNGERLNGGMAKLPESAGKGVPPHWLPYFGVSDIDAAAQTVADAGGEVMAGPMDIPAGKLAVAADPQGAVFGLFSGDLDD